MPTAHEVGRTVRRLFVYLIILKVPRNTCDFCGPHTFCLFSRASPQLAWRVQRAALGHRFRPPPRIPPRPPRCSVGPTKKNSSSPPPLAPLICHHYHRALVQVSLEQKRFTVRKTETGCRDRGFDRSAAIITADSVQTIHKRGP